MRLYVFRSCAAVALAAATLFTSGAISSRAKGIRAIVFHGEHLDSPVRVDRAGGAESLYVGLLNGKTSSARPLDGRPCVRLAVFSEVGRSARVPLEQLSPEEGDFQIRYYPPKQDHPALAVLPQDRSVQVHPADVVLIENLGVTAKATAAGCGA